MGKVGLMGRQAGGNVKPGEPYVVGERGPELLYMGMGKDQVAAAMDELRAVIDDPENLAKEIARIEAALASDALATALDAPFEDRRRAAEEMRAVLIEQRDKLSEGTEIGKG